MGYIWEATISSEGAKAAQAGAEFTDNPYEADTPSYEAWARGWRDVIKLRAWPLG